MIKSKAGNANRLSFLDSCKKASAVDTRICTRSWAGGAALPPKWVCTMMFSSSLIASACCFTRRRVGTMKSIFLGEMNSVSNSMISKRANVLWRTTLSDLPVRFQEMLDNHICYERLARSSGQHHDRVRRILYQSICNAILILSRSSQHHAESRR